jgi:flagellar basal body rod protein FlgG
MGKILKNMIMLIISLCMQNIFADDLSLYQYCLQDLNNYNTIGYKSHMFYNDTTRINFSTGYVKITDGFYHIVISGRGFFRVLKENKVYYTRRGDFLWDFDNKTIVNRDGYTLELRKQLNEDAERGDIRVNIQLYIIDIRNCQTNDNIYFEFEEIPENDSEGKIFFGCLENSNVSAFYCLLMMKQIIHTNIDKIKNSDYLLEIINILIIKLNTDEYIGRDINWLLLQQWIPYLNIDSAGEDRNVKK